MTRPDRDPWVRRHTPHYDEVTRILGPTRSKRIADERVRQISRRWLKADQIIEDCNGELKLNAAGDDIMTESVRIRIPRDSWMRRDFKRSR